MNPWLGASLALHIVLLLLIYFGLPNFADKRLDMPLTAIPVDIVDIGPITNTKIADQKVEEPKPMPEAPKAAPPPPSKEQEPVKPVEEPKKAEPEPPKDAEAIPDKTKKKEEKKKEKKPEPPKEQLSSVLKNIKKLKEQIQETKPSPVLPPSDKSVPTPPTAAPALSDRLSISELDLLRRQIQSCWNVPVGARGIEDMMIEVLIEVNPDRTVARASIVDMGRMASDTFFRTVAESALRALYNPRCSPLQLPQDRYNDWQTIRFYFSPKEML